MVLLLEETIGEKGMAAKLGTASDTSQARRHCTTRALNDSRSSPDDLAQAPSEHCEAAIQIRHRTKRAASVPRLHASGSQLQIFQPGQGTGLLQ